MNCRSILGAGAVVLMMALPGSSADTQDVNMEPIEWEEDPLGIETTLAHNGGVTVDPDPYSCYAEDTSGGPGDSSASCGFACKKASTVSLSTHSSDSVYVSGNADCGDVHAHCGDQHSCSAVSSDLTKYEGAGSCSARSDEWWSSYLYVECSAGGTGNPVCQISCTAGASSFDPVAAILVWGDQVAGAVCRGNECVFVLPTLTVDPLREELWWTIDGASEFASGPLAALLEDVIRNGPDLLESFDAPPAEAGDVAA